MYQLAVETGPVDKTRLFIDTCTSLVPSADTLSTIRSATSLMRSALKGADLKMLRQFVSRVEERDGNADDVLAAAGQAVVDECDDLPHTKLHDVIRRVARIERDVLAAAGSDRWDAPRAAYAG